MKTKTKALIFFIILSIVMAGLLSFPFVLSENYQKAYNTPKNNGGLMDFEGFDMEKIAIDAIMSGDWELYYGKWIVTDNIECEKDRMLKIPSSFNGLTINGAKATANIASYKIKVKNLKVGSRFIVQILNHPISYRAYVNRTLTISSGIPGKTFAENKVNGRVDYSQYYVVDKTGELEIIIETGIDHNGITSSPRVKVDKGTEGLSFFVFFLFIFIASIMFAYLLFNIFLNKGAYFKDQYTNSLIVAFSFIFLLFSKDSFGAIKTYFNINYKAFLWAYLLSGLCLLIFFVVHFAKNKNLTLSKKQYIIFAIYNSIFVIAFLIFKHTLARFSFIVMMLLSFYSLIYPMCKLDLKKAKYSSIYIAIYFCTIALIAFGAIDFFGLIVFGGEGALSVGLTMLMVLLSVVNILKIRNLNQIALKALQLERTHNLIQQQALREQIKPHFIFNCLTAIEYTYQQSDEEGSQLVSKFGQHLRSQINSSEKELVEFDDEIKCITNYVDLENYRFQGKINFLLDIGYSDFSVPSFSLQPFVENAIKYAGTQDKEDGYIQLSSSLQEDKIIIAICDNGAGFDIKNIHDEAIGLKNATKRLNMILNAQVYIDSIIGEGTCVKVTFQK